MSHIWSKEGSCEIKVIAMDETGDESSWSDILKINIYKQITLNEEIEIELNISKNNIVNESINFNLSTTNLEDNNLLFNWDFGDGTNSIEKQPDHKYSQSGTYTITLIISDENGNVISNTSYQVTITESSESIINEMEITEKKQKNNYIALFALSLIFITLFGALVLFSKKISKVYSKNYYGRNYNQRRLGLSNKTHSYFLSHKNRSIDKSAYNFDLKTSKTRKISANFTQSNSSKHPKDSEQKLRSYIDDILSKYDEKK